MSIFYEEQYLSRFVTNGQPTSQHNVRRKTFHKFSEYIANDYERAVSALAQVNDEVGEVLQTLLEMWRKHMRTQTTTANTVQPTTTAGQSGAEDAKGDIEAAGGEGGGETQNGSGWVIGEKGTWKKSDGNKSQLPQKCPLIRSAVMVEFYVSHRATVVHRSVYCSGRRQPKYLG